jgi:HAMP domain-containing protein
MIRKVRNSLSELNHLLFAYVSYREDRPKQQFLAECDSLTKLIAGIRLRDSEEHRLLADIRRSSQGMKDLFLRLVSVADLSGPAGAEGFSKEVEERLVGQLLTRSHRADSSASHLKSLVDDEIKNTHAGTIALILVVLVLAATPLTFMLLRTRRSITTSLAELRNGTEVVRSGNLDHSITVEREDEIGELSQAFN